MGWVAGGGRGLQARVFKAGGQWCRARQWKGRGRFAEAPEWAPEAGEGRTGGGRGSEQGRSSVFPPAVA